MSDPVAAKSASLCVELSADPSELAFLVKYWGKISEHVTNVQMTSIDTQGMTLSCSAGAGEKKEVRIKFTPPLFGYDDAKSRLVLMGERAKAALGVTPRITSFRFPPDALISGSTIVLLVYTYWSPTPSSPSYSPIFSLANRVLTFLTEPVTRGIWFTVLIIHVLEALYVLSLCRQHKTGFFVGAQYGIATMLFGIPILQDLKRRAKKAERKGM